MHAFRNRLAQYSDIPDKVWNVIQDIGTKPGHFKAGADIIRVGEITDSLFIISTGWATRFRTLEDGRRQIVNFMLPGDIFDLQALARMEADHSVSALTDVSILSISPQKFIRKMRESGEVSSAFWWAAVQEESILREQAVRLGRRSARERIGHLLLELQRRMNGALGSNAEQLSLPLTRVDLADALGLTPVHVSRTMSAMRSAGLIEEHRGLVLIRDRQRLARLSHFDPDYLHLRKLDYSRFSEDTPDVPSKVV
ncbi:Crp/Fnr family transcriptional regulator [Hyphomonas johnsonii]|uniref:Crp-Fnr family transcriptional regulator n=1 Tax=Hyphomonas johnsonii MHS-2 TaxID=1280950 RepID=A0A059FTB0_9PROT|nr:Crp/Fnr family transcriptional regulator [Hyphomonas johnsonii]KCZ93915.1 Crp-Fnr family transcriptional regulator [Hyphomonas johnsonii MHS-2]